MKNYRDFLDLITHTYSRASCITIVSALRYAAQQMRGMKRYGGQDFIMHSVGVAHIVVKEVGLGRNSTVAALLHDVFRLGKISPEQVKELYGEKCLEILRGLNNISQVDPKTSTLQAENFKELIISYSTDPRVILIKLADRLEVMRELESFPELKRNKKSWETINLYAPLAHKLGLYVIKSEMEDLSLKYLETKDYNSIQKKLADSEHERREFIEKFKAPIIEKLDSLGLNYKLKSRTKSIYSIWRKMHQQNVNFEGVYDVFAVRIIIDCEAEFEKMHCWTAFSVVTDFYLPNPDRMRDWISIPKSNGYESLHATVLVDKLATPPRWVEVQIRSQRMDEVAERGVAAHWRYKGNSAGNITSEQWLERLRSVVESTDGASAALKEEFDLTQGTSEVFVFTPTGDIRKLPEGATLLDFAFDIHTNVGAACTGGRINGRNVSIREMLRSGDIAEVVTSKNQKAKADWLNFVVTNKAKGKIKQILREAQANSSILGREELERKVKNWKIPLTVEECVNYLSKYFKVRTGMEVYTAIAQGRVPMIEIKEFLQKAYEGTLPAGVAKPRKEPAERKTDSQDMMIIDNGLAQVDYKLGKCCNPIFGDEVFGFVTVNGGITIHRKDCPNAQRLKEQYKYRVHEARWSQTTVGGAFRAQIRIQGEDRAGMATTITEMVSRTLNINIRTLNIDSKDGQVTGTLAIEVASSTMVDMVVAHLKKIAGVNKVSRVN